MLFHQFIDPSLAQYAYLIGCQQTGEALLIDPLRDVDQYAEKAREEGLTLTAAAETHIHADFLSGARELAERYGVALYLSAEGEDEGWGSAWAKDSSYSVTFLRDGDTFHVGNVEITTLHTPGHTPEHMSYLVTDHGGGASTPMGIASGDFVFVGDLGRPDLLESAAGQAGAQDPAARRLFASVQRFLALDDQVQVWPGHGAGSACGKALGAVPQSTVGYERAYNGAIEAVGRGKRAFVEAILSGQPEPPLYFARMKQQNRDGVPLLGELPKPRALTADELVEAGRNEGVVLIDTRADRSAFMAMHLRGSLYSPLTTSFSAVVGSYVADPEAALVLIAEEDRVEKAVRDLVRLGLDNVIGYAVPPTLDEALQREDAVASIEEVTFETVAGRAAEAVVLDVRRRSEYEAGHVPGAANVAHTRLAGELSKVPEGRPLYVHCQRGGRAAAAAAYLAREGFPVVYVNDGFPKYAAAHETDTNPEYAVADSDVER